jgi:hypothetical protein
MRQAKQYMDSRCHELSTTLYFLAPSRNMVTQIKPARLFVNDLTRRGFIDDMSLRFPNIYV